MFSSQNSQVSSDANFIEDVFSTYLYTGNGSTQTITNGIDLAGEGGLVWVKPRSVQFHNLYDTVRGTNSILYSNTTDAAESKSPAPLVSYNTTGFTLDSYTGGNASGTNFASWTFRKQPKFFDIVTYTGNGTAGRTVVHNLGSVPGCIIVKRTDTADAWAVYHRGVNSGTGNGLLVLNTTAAQNVNGKFWWGDNTNFIAPTSTNFTVSTDGQVNASGGTYVAYVFAHDAGGFGLTGTDNVISCGTYTIPGAPLDVNLGYEPQFLLIKRTDTTGDWYIIDTMRGFTVSANPVTLKPNSSDPEGGLAKYRITNTGFGGAFDGGDSGTYIYIAIRRPMKVPTLGTSVFTPIARTGTGANATVTSVGFPVDLLMSTSRQGFDAESWWDRLRNTGGAGRLLPSSTSAEIAGSTDSLTGLDVMDGFKVGVDTNGRINYSPWTYVYHCFRRAPGFFDEVCYTGNGSTAANGQIVAHNLTVSPELLIIKPRSIAGSWITWASSLGVDGSGRYYDLLLETSGARGLFTLNGNALTTSPIYSTTQIGVGGANTNASTQTYVAYLFATVAGVSKVGSYTGTGALQTVACGFTSGARFVLIKRTDAVGDWYVWDSARGITSGNDPYLLLNTTAAEVTATNYVDTDTTGFKVTAAAPAGINASGGTFLFLAIA